MATELAQAGRPPAHGAAPSATAALDAAGPFRRVAPELPAGLAARRNITLFVAAAAVTSTAHYDNSANTHVLLRGHKRLLLAPPCKHARSPPLEL